MMTSIQLTPLSLAETTTNLLSETADRLRSLTEVGRTMDRLSRGLWELRQRAGAEWSDVVEAARQHPVSELVLLDPFTRHSRQRPRGYAGDAGLLDLIYHDQGFSNEAPDTDLGAEIYRRNRDAPAPLAVRERRDHLASLLDRTADAAARPKALVVAAGHFREGLLSEAVNQGRFVRLVALDQDVDSLAEIRRCFGSTVEPVQCSVKDLLGPALEDEKFDLIYAAGLYDYLADRFATRLTARLFDRLAPGGQLHVANFVPEIPDVGYMECYMDWHLIYRRPDDLEALAAEIPQGTRRSVRAYSLNSRDVAYLEVVR